MDAQKSKAQRSLRRKFRVRKSIRGTAQKPRLSVYRSNLHIYAQLIDDEAQVTLAAASSNDKGGDVKYGGNVAAATLVGQKIAALAKVKGIATAAFDRGHYRFHGRVKALARAATLGGLICTGLEDTPKVKRESAPPPATKAAKVKGGDGKKKEAAKA